MTKSRRLLLGIASLLPLLLLLLYLVLFLGLFIQFFRNGQHPELIQELVLKNIVGLIAFGFLMGLIALGLLIYFIIHVVNNSVIDTTERIVWIIIFLFAGMIGFPIYWYMRIWKQV